jgi:hypothetical protein
MPMDLFAHCCLVSVCDRCIEADSKALLETLAHTELGQIDSLQSDQHPFNAIPLAPLE